MKNVIEVLAKKLRRYRTEDIIRFCTFYSFRTLNINTSMDIENEKLIYPWELDSLLLIKIWTGTAEGNMYELTNTIFIGFIETIREYDLVDIIQESGRNDLKKMNAVVKQRVEREKKKNPE